MKHIVGFSGGIDSQACARWVLNRYTAEDVILLNSDAGGNEHPLTTEFVREYSEKVHPVLLLSAKVKHAKRPGARDALGLSDEDVMDFGLLAQLKGRFPSSQAQFCTEALKLAPARDWVQENLRDEEYERYAGVRRDESKKRRHAPFRAWDDYFDCYVNHPLADWNKQQCFEFVKGEPVNELYRLGFTRVGCAPCIECGKEDIRRWADRFPEMIGKVRDWEICAGRTFFAPMVPGKAINWIDEVVEWSRTDWGGRQFNILLAEGMERPACESKFGLCE